MQHSGPPLCEFSRGRLSHKVSLREGDTPLNAWKSRIGCAGCTAALIATAGCASTPRAVDDPARRDLLTLLMPSRIEIVEPFTRVKSFDDDTTPDGIELLLRAVNSLDNPGLMIAGQVRVELFEHVAGSADQKGRRLEHWDVELATAAQQRRYWNQLTQMYEFRLGIDPTVMPKGDKYVLLVTYNSPLGEHLNDECVISYRSGASASPSAGSRKP